MSLPVVAAVGALAYVSYNMRQAAPEIAETVRSLEKPLIMTAAAFAVYAYVFSKK